MFGQFEDVFSQQRFAAGENDDRLPDPSNLIHDFQALLGAQFAGVGATTCRGPAVNAVQVAVPGHLPSHQTRPSLLMWMTFVHEPIRSCFCSGALLLLLQNR